MQAMMFAGSFATVRSSGPRSASEIASAVESFYAAPRRGLPQLGVVAATLGAMALYVGFLGVVAS